MAKQLPKTKIVAAVGAVVIGAGLTAPAGAVDGVTGTGRISIAQATHNGGAKTQFAVAGNTAFGSGGIGGGAFDGLLHDRMTGLSTRFGQRRHR